MSDAKKTRHDPETARKMAGGDPGWYRDIVVPAQTVGAACSRCGVRVGLVGLSGLCLRCSMDRRREQIERRAIPSTE